MSNTLGGIVFFGKQRGGHLVQLMCCRGRRWLAAGRDRGRSQAGAGRRVRGHLPSGGQTGPRVSTFGFPSVVLKSERCKGLKLTPTS